VGCPKRKSNSYFDQMWYVWSITMLDFKAKPENDGEEYQDQIQRYCVRLEHHNPICEVQSSNGLTKPSRCRIWNISLNYTVKQIQELAGQVNISYYLLSRVKMFEPAFKFLSVTSFERPIGNMPPSSLRTTVKWLSTPFLFHSDATIGPSIWKMYVNKDNWDEILNQIWYHLHLIAKRKKPDFMCKWTRTFGCHRLHVHQSQGCYIWRRIQVSR